MGIIGVKRVAYFFFLISLLSILFTNASYVPMITTATIYQSHNTYYATFGGYQQKLVRTHQGEFISLLHSFLPGSGDGISSGIFIWQILYRRYGDTNWQWKAAGYTDSKSPAIETDGSSVFVVAPRESKYQYSAFFYRFDPGYDGNYNAAPVVKILQNAWSGKYNLTYVPATRELVYMTWDRSFRLNVDGEVLSSSQLFKTNGIANQVPQYPMMAADSGFVVASINTTGISDISNLNGWYNGTNTYPSFGVFGSWNGGTSWSTFYSGTPVWPVDPSENGPLLHPTLPWQRILSAKNFLTGLFIKSGYVHMFYVSTDTQSPARFGLTGCYRRLFLGTNVLDYPMMDKNPFGSGSSGINSPEQGFFASDSQKSSIYLVGVEVKAGDQRIVVLKSFNNGTTWVDHSVGNFLGSGYTIHNLGGSRRITNATISGIYTLKKQLTPGASPTYSSVHFSVPAGD